MTYRLALNSRLTLWHVSSGYKMIIRTIASVLRRHTAKKPFHGAATKASNKVTFVPRKQDTSRKYTIFYHLQSPTAEGLQLTRLVAGVERFWWAEKIVYLSTAFKLKNRKNVKEVTLVL